MHIASGLAIFSVTLMLAAAKTGMCFYPSSSFNRKSNIYKNDIINYFPMMTFDLRHRHKKFALVFLSLSISNYQIRREINWLFHFILVSIVNLSLVFFSVKWTCLFLFRFLSVGPSHDKLVVCYISTWAVSYYLDISIASFCQNK